MREGGRRERDRKGRDAVSMAEKEIIWSILISNEGKLNRGT